VAAVLLAAAAAVSAFAVVRRARRTNALAKHDWLAWLPHFARNRADTFVARARRHRLSPADLASPLAFALASRLGALGLIFAGLHALDAPASIGVVATAYCVGMLPASPSRFSRAPARLKPRPPWPSSTAASRPRRQSARCSSGDFLNFGYRSSSDSSSRSAGRQLGGPRPSGYRRHRRGPRGLFLPSRRRPRPPGRVAYVTKHLNPRIGFSSASRGIMSHGAVARARHSFCAAFWVRPSGG
jgi:hypothetical protein